jgi:dihydrofolate reductase
MKHAEKYNHEEGITNEIVIIGGGYLFEETSSIVNKLIISKVDCNVSGDIYYPQIDMRGWKLVTSESFKKNLENDYDFRVEEYERL